MELKKQDTTNKVFLTINIVMAFVTLLLAITLIAWNIKGSTAIEYKSAASASFAALGISNLIYAIIIKKKRIIVPILMTCALLFAMAADVILQMDGMFMIGGALFGIAHILFIVSFCFIKRVHWLDLIGLIPGIIVVILILVSPIFTWENTTIKIFACVYAIIVCLMGGKGISNFIRERNKLNLVILVGALLFMISDFCLLFDMFADINPCNLHCHIFYYPAEIALAMSIYVFDHNYKGQVK